MTDATVAGSRPTAGARMGSRHPATSALAALLVVGGVLLLYAGRHLTFFYDEWDFILGRRGGSVATYLDPHNGHLVVFPVLVYKLLFELVGLRHYTPYLAVSVVLHLLSCALLYVLARRRLGPWLALAPVVLLLFMGSAWQDLLWPFQMSYLASVAGGLGTLVLIDGPGRPRDAAAAALLTWSVFSSGVGLAFAVASAVMLITRRDPPRRLWIVALPLVLFGIWYLGWATGEHITSESLLGAPQYDASAAAASAAGVAGLDVIWGPPLIVAVLVVVAMTLRSRGDTVPAPLLLAAACGALAFWTLAALTRADASDPASSRYLYVGAVFVLLIVAEAARGTRLRGFYVVPVAILLLGAVIANLSLLRQGERALRASDENVRAALGVVEVAAPIIPSTFAPAPVDAPQITAAPYLAAARALGSPALNLAELERSSESVRERSDGLLGKAELIALVPASGGAGGTCQRLRPTQGGSIVTVSPGGEISLQGPPGSSSILYIRRLASTFSSPFATAAGGRDLVLRFPPDRAPQLSWQVRVVPSGPTEICAR